MSSLSKAEAYGVLELPSGNLRIW